MINKILHFIDVIRPGGGPSGYLYNLKNAEEGHDYFVYSVSRSDDRTGQYNKKKFPTFILRHILAITYIIRLLGLKKIPNEQIINKYKYTLVHSVPMASRLLKVKHKEIKLGLMYHGPVSYSTEVMDNLVLGYGDFLSKAFYKRILQYLENRLYKKMDFIVTAAKEGLNAYTDIKFDYENKLFEVTTGLPEIKSRLSKMEARDLVGLPQNKMVVGYFGRYHSHKGYDIYRQEIDLLSTRDDIQFISAGIGPLNAVSSNNYINFGWRTDIQNLITACDIIALPNRYTYFDLLPLECLSLSRPVAVSRIGGNLKLERLCPVAFGFDMKPGELSKLIAWYAEKSNDEKMQYEEKARCSFNTHFDEFNFSRNHDELYLALEDFFAKE
ncbi:TPA: glycosyltransferase [Yersinia enterocolitica]